MTDLDLGAGLDGRAVIVTGAASGIGRATARLLARAGAIVIAVDRDRRGVSETVDGLAGAGHVARTADLADIGAIPTIVDESQRSAGGLWALLHVAAVLRRRPLHEVTEEDWDLQATVNLKAAFFLNRAAGQAMIDGGGGGRIVNFTSAAFLTGALSGSDAYVANKGGIVTMTRSFARAYGPHGILVNAISPGQIDTPMQHVDNPPEVVEASRRACPLGRMGRPEEIAAVAVFLASRHASFINGATINVSGGSVMY